MSTRRPDGRPARDEGSGTVLVLVAGAVLLGVGGAALTGAQAVGARRSLAGTADLTAVAGAAAAGDRTTRCAAAAAIARDNGAALVRCDVAPDATVGVTVSRALRLPLAALARQAGIGPQQLSVSARAGPSG